MRTTVDIPELFLRQVRSRAALEGRKMNDIVNEALRHYLSGERPTVGEEDKLPDEVELRQLGRFRIPVIRSVDPGKREVSLEVLKESETEEDEKRHATLFGR